MCARLFLLFIGLVGALSARPTLIREKDLAPDFSGVKLVFCSVRSYNLANSWKNKGYLQSIPGFLIQLILENQKVLSQMCIVLIDLCWDPKGSCAKSGYEQSDLRRYLSSLGELGKKIEARLYLVGESFSLAVPQGQKSSAQASPSWLTQALVGVAKSGGVVFLDDSSGGLVPRRSLEFLYGIVRNNATEKKNIQWTSPLSGDASRVEWFGDHELDDILYAIFLWRLEGFGKTLLRLKLEEALRDPLLDFQAKHVIYKNNLGYYKALVALRDANKVFDVTTGTMVPLTMSFFTSAPLPYMVVSNDPASKKYPLLEYELDTSNSKQWKLIHKLNWKNSGLK